MFPTGNNSEGAPVKSKPKSVHSEIEQEKIKIWRKKYYIKKQESLLPEDIFIFSNSISECTDFGFDLTGAPSLLFPVGNNGGAKGARI